MFTILLAIFVVLLIIAVALLMSYVLVKWIDKQLME